MSNGWLYYYNLANIGGILGIGFNESGGGDFWTNNTFAQKAYSVQLTPNASDWAWMADPPKISSKEPSYIEFGNFDVGAFSQDNLAVMLVSKATNSWRFTTKSF